LAPNLFAATVSNFTMNDVAVTPIRVLASRNLSDMEFIHFSQPRNYEISRHSHPAAIITIVLEGSFTETIEGSKHHCVPGTILMKPSGALHTLKYSSTGARCLLIEIGNIDFLSVDLYRDEDLGYSILKEFLTPDKSSEVKLQEYVYRLASRHRSGTRIKHPRSAPSWLENAKDFINDRARDPIGLAEIAQAAGVHPAHLSETFPKFFRCTAGEYLRHIRLSWALQRITNSDQAIVEIALAAGFYDQSHFYRFFKRHTGLNPVEMRRWAASTRA
jgi:AraC family transcriptional regulator